MGSVRFKISLMSFLETNTKFNISNGKASQPVKEAGFHSWHNDSMYKTSY